MSTDFFVRRGQTITQAYKKQPDRKNCGPVHVIKFLGKGYFA